MTRTIPPRRPDWKGRLARYVTECFQRPFVPGQFDCALFVAGAVEAMTGHDPAAPFKGVYTSFEEGLTILRAAGHDDPVAMVAALFEEVHPVFAQPGDIVTVDGQAGYALGIVQGDRVYALHPDGAGVGLVPRDRVLRAWRV